MKNEREASVRTHLRQGVVDSLNKRCSRGLLPAAALVWLLAGAGCASRNEDHVAKGDRFLADGKIQDAQAEYRIALRRSGRPPEEMLWNLGILDLHSKNMSEARAQLTRLVERDEDYRERVVGAFLLFAARWFEAGDPFQAVQAVEAARELDPTRNLGPYYYPMGDYHFELPDYERAVEDYLLATALAPGLEPQATYRLAVALERLGRWPQAVTYYRAYAATDEEKGASREVRYHLGEAAFRSAQASFLNHRYPEALEYLNVVLEAGQPEARLDDAYYLLGEIRYRGGNHSEAEAAFMRVLELAPSSSSRLYGEAERRLLDIRFGGT